MAPSTTTFGQTSAREFVLHTLENMLRQIRFQHVIPEESFAEAYHGLEALPLTTEEFAQGKLNLQNARNYLQDHGWGAARFELSLLYRRLTNQWLRTAEHPTSRLRMVASRRHVVSRAS